MSLSFSEYPSRMSTRAVAGFAAGVGRCRYEVRCVGPLSSSLRRLRSRTPSVARRGDGNGEVISDTGRLVPVGDVIGGGAGDVVVVEVVLVVVVVAPVPATSIRTGAFNRMLLRIASFRSNSFEALMAKLGE